MIKYEEYNDIYIFIQNNKQESYFITTFQDQKYFCALKIFNLIFIT